MGEHDMSTRHPWELHTGQHVRWGGTTITVLHEPELDHGSYHVPARRSDTGAQVDMELSLAHTVEVADAQPAQFKMDRSSWDHTTGDTGCAGCWSDAYPVDCDEDGCGGLVHAEFEDESEDSIILTYQCDRCGSTGPPSITY